MKTNLSCDVIGLGAWGPGFVNWTEFEEVLAGSKALSEEKPKAPKPDVIPANERRRAPLPVKMAVEVSSQALAQAGIAASDVACVFGSGLGDTDITDYMCRVLTTEQKQLSPTKFHNSVHNAAAGYWTISSGNMKSANSVAAYYETAGLSLLEAMVQCEQDNEPVLITLFDTEAHAAYKDVFPCEQPFAAAILICPRNTASANAPLATITIDEMSQNVGVTEPTQASLVNLYQTNPAARVVPLLAAIHARSEYDDASSWNSQKLNTKISKVTCLSLQVS